MFSNFDFPNKAAAGRLVTRRRWIGSAGGLMCLAMLACSAMLSGCGALGALAGKMPRAPVKAEYSLAGKSVGVMVWADRGVLIDWPSIQLDLAGGIQARLIEAQKAKSEDLKESTFPVMPASIIRWQREHPGYEAESITEVASRLGVQRLIYVEITRFGTRAGNSVNLFRGSATVTLKVIEVNESKGKIAHEQPDISTFFPKTSTPDGSPNGTDSAMYVGTVQRLADELAKRFVEHPED